MMSLSRAYAQPANPMMSHPAELDSSLPADTSLASLMVAEAWHQRRLPSRSLSVVGADAARRQALIARINKLEAEETATWWRSFA